MPIIFHLMGISFFLAFATSGFTTTTIILYWIFIAASFMISLSYFGEIARSNERLKNNKRITTTMQSMLDMFGASDYNSKIANVLCSTVVHVYIAFYLLHAPVLAIGMVLVAIYNVHVAFAFKDIIKKCQL